MKCPHCGTENPDGAAYCVECAKPLASPDAAPPVPPPAPGPPPQVPQPSVQTYLIPAIAVTVLCCLPFGIVAIVYAAQAKSKLDSGDHAGALEASQKAKTWTIVSAVVGLVAGVIWMILAVAGGMAGY